VIAFRSLRNDDITQWHRNHGGSGGWCPCKNFCFQHIPHVVFFAPNSIALSCSARTDVLNCSVGTDGAETDKFFLLPTNFFSLRCFFLIRGKCIVENSDVSQ